MGKKIRSGGVGGSGIQPEIGRILPREQGPEGIRACGSARPQQLWTVTSKTFVLIAVDYTVELR
jgi:hypothetical protein